MLDRGAGADSPYRVGLTEHLYIRSGFGPLATRWSVQTKSEAGAEAGAMGAQDQGTHTTRRVDTSTSSAAYSQGQPGKFLYRRGGQAFEIDAAVVGTSPLQIVYTDPGSKALAGGQRKVYRVLRTAEQLARFRALREEEQPAGVPDPEQRLRDAAWEGEIDGLTTSQIAAQFDLDRQRASGVLTRILQGKSSDPRFGKPAGSTYHDKRALINGGRVLTRARHRPA